MRWPWKGKSSHDQVIASWSGGAFAYVKAPANSAGLFAVQQMGVEHQGADSLEDFVRRLQALGLKGVQAHVMLRPEQYQLLQIDSPPVAPEELRAAARFQIREMVNVHIDDITLDVMQVGDGQQKGPSHLFVVAAKNEVVRDVMALGDALNWKVPVIDIQETAQRNLQSALAKQDGRLDRADACLLISDERQAVLTISANEELFFTRRLDLPAGFLTMPWGAGHDAAADEVPDAFTPVGEYVPDYAVPAGQHAQHDNHEATESVWLPPRVALEQYWTGQIELAPPQIMSLAHLARHGSVQSVLEGARSQHPPLIFPETFDDNGTRVLCYPGDPAHSVSARALPGPTRLLYRKGRFAPMDGRSCALVGLPLPLCQRSVFSV